jgi:hypothetical protein
MDGPQKGRDNHPAMRTSAFIWLALCLFMTRLGAQSLPQANGSPRVGGSQGANGSQQAGESPQANDSFPQARITNGLVRVRLYLPDTASGYYRGTRFDWSGVMPDLEYKGHTYAGQWFKTYAPTIHDAIMGPVESFAPLGYETAKPGGHFIAIGIGALTRIDAKPYGPFRYYPIANPGKWTIKAGSDRVAFVHRLSDSGYAYTYTKTVRLVKGKAELVLEHQLRNTGQKTIETDVYDHNLFLIDHQPTGPGLAISFPFGLSGTQERRITSGMNKAATGEAGTTNLADTAAIALIRDSQIVFLRRPAGKEDVYTVLSGYGDSAKDYAIRIENHHTGAGMRITSDQPLSKLVFWASATTACPEAYVHISLQPGETFSWSIFYQFYDVSTVINEP